MQIIDISFEIQKQMLDSSMKIERIIKPIMHDQAIVFKLTAMLVATGLQICLEVCDSGSIPIKEFVMCIALQNTITNSFKSLKFVNMRVLMRKWVRITFDKDTELESTVIMSQFSEKIKIHIYAIHASFPKHEQLRLFKSHDDTMSKYFGYQKMLKDLINTFKVIHLDSKKEYTVPEILLTHVSKPLNAIISHQRAVDNNPEGVVTLNLDEEYGDFSLKFLCTYLNGGIFDKEFPFFEKSGLCETLKFINQYDVQAIFPLAMNALDSISFTLDFEDSFESIDFLRVIALNDLPLDFQKIRFVVKLLAQSLHDKHPNLYNKLDQPEKDYFRMLFERSLVVVQPEQTAYRIEQLQ